LDHVWPHPRGLNVYIVTYREMLLKKFFSRTTWPISTKLGRKHAWRMGIQVCSNKGACPFWGPIRDKIRKILINLLLMNHKPECIDI